MKYATHSAIAATGIALFDVFVDGRSFSESFVRDDAMTAAVAILTSSFVFDVVSGLLPYLHDNNSLSMISKPLLVGLVYMMLYDYFMMNRYNNYRENSKAFYIGAIGSLLLNYINSPLLSLFGIQSYGN